MPALFENAFREMPQTLTTPPAPSAFGCRARAPLLREEGNLTPIFDMVSTSGVPSHKSHEEQCHVAIASIRVRFVDCRVIVGSAAGCPKGREGRTVVLLFCGPRQHRLFSGRSHQ